METPEVDKDTGNNLENKAQSYIPGKPYSKLRRELSDDDLSNPAVQKLLISEIDKLEIQVSELEIIEKQFHEVDKSKAVLEEKIKSSNSLEILYSFCLSIGSAVLGLSSLFKINEYGWIFIVVGGILIIGGILSKYVKWN
jgi:hypothetical protein